ncbi:MAG: hypothetical protein AAFR99_05670 [Cyanobacteria bacterium J06629_9]
MDINIGNIPTAATTTAEKLFAWLGTHLATFNEGEGIKVRNATSVDSGREFSCATARVNGVDGKSYLQVLAFIPLPADHESQTAWEAAEEITQGPGVANWYS